MLPLARRGGVLVPQRCRCNVPLPPPPQVVVVEQTETPDMLKARNEERARQGLKKVLGTGTPCVFGAEGVEGLAVVGHAWPKAAPLEPRLRGGTRRDACA